jgi:hypothetical protein
MTAADPTPRTEAGVWDDRSYDPIATLEADLAVARAELERLREAHGPCIPVNEDTVERAMDWLHAPHRGEDYCVIRENGRLRERALSLLAALRDEVDRPTVPQNSAETTALRDEVSRG